MGARRKPGSRRYRKEMVGMATTVIIPALNEETSIGEIVEAFCAYPSTSGNVFVGIDSHTTDKTGFETRIHGGVPIATRAHGKGQVVRATLHYLRQNVFVSDRIILCDGDYIGLKPDHIDLLFKYSRGMVIGVPEFPPFDVPSHVITAWPMVSGFRYLNPDLIPEDAHGYLLETQLNKRAAKGFVPVNYKFMMGLMSPFLWPLPERRMKALEEDRQWGMQHGIL